MWAITRLRWTAAALAIVAVVLSSPKVAKAEVPLPDVVEQNIGGIAEYYAKTSHAADLGCSQVCALVEQDFERPPTVPPAAPSLPPDPVKGPWYKSFLDRGKSAVKRPWKFPPNFVRYSVVGALVAANYYVWKVRVYDQIAGRNETDYYIKIPQAAFSLSEVKGWKITDGIDDDNFYSTFYDKPDPIPVGIVAVSSNYNAVLWQTSQDSATGTPSYCNRSGPVSPPDWVQEFSWYWNKCQQYSWGGQLNPSYAHGWKIHVDVALNPDLDPVGRPDSPQTFSTDLSRMTREEIEQRLRDLLASNDPDYAKLRNWLCALLGGECRNPKDLYPRVPSCYGATPAVCIQRFRDAGFTGPVTEEVLPDDRAVVELGAGVVTDSDPNAGIEDVSNHDIVLYKNPDPMPALSPADEQLADTLAARNPETVNDTNKRTIARTCRRLMQRAARPDSDCETIPIFVVGHESPTPAENDWEAMERHPSWAVLNRRNTSGLSRGGWYYDRATPEPGCLEADKSLPTWECDEYPYFSALQGYGGTLNIDVPGIRWAPRRENRYEGNALQQFYSTRLPGDTMTFRGCGITQQDAADIVPLNASRYIVVPIGHSEKIATTGICNGL